MYHLIALKYATPCLQRPLSLGADFVVTSAYKFFGPHVGILWGRDGILWGRNGILESSGGIPRTRVRLLSNSTFGSNLLYEITHLR